MIRFFFLILLTNTALAECQQLVKLVGTIDVQKNKWIEAYRAKKPEKICIDTNSKNPTLELAFAKGSNKHSQKIFTSLNGYYDNIQKRKLTGGMYDLKQIIVHAWAPEWVTGSNLRITDINGKKLILEVKL